MRLFIYIFDFGKIQGTPKRILHIQSLETQIHMNAASSCFQNGGNIRKQSRASFAVQASVTAAAYSGRAGGGESCRGWDNKSRNIRPCRLDILTPAE